MKPLARIDDWTHEKWGSGSFATHCLVGRISNHPNQANFKAPLQRTSKLVYFAPSKGEAETLNTHYILGNKLDHKEMSDEELKADVEEMLNDASGG